MYENLKPNIKIIKAEQVTIQDDKAPQTQKKYPKTLKNPKEDEMAELRYIEAHSGIRTTEFTKPADIMSTQNPTTDPAEVCQQRLHYQPKPTDKTPSSTETFCGDEEQNSWCDWGSPWISPKPVMVGSNTHNPTNTDEMRKHAAHPGRKSTKEDQPENNTNPSKTLATLLTKKNHKPEAEEVLQELLQNEPRETTNNRKHEERLKGGTGTLNKRKRIEVAGETEESKSKDKPQDFQDGAEWNNGLVNLGNTCYLSACMQCLSGCTALLDALSKTKVKNRTDKKITAHLRDACQEITKKNRATPYSPSDIHSAIMKLSACSE